MIDRKTSTHHLSCSQEQVSSNMMSSSFLCRYIQRVTFLSDGTTILRFSARSPPRTPQIQTYQSKLPNHRKYNEGGSSTVYLNMINFREEKLRNKMLSLPLCIYSGLKLTILANLSANKLAPPTKHPSISLLAINPSTLSGVTLPPY